MSVDPYKSTMSFPMQLCSPQLSSQFTLPSPPSYTKAEPCAITLPSVTIERPAKITAEVRSQQTRINGLVKLLKTCSDIKEAKMIHGFVSKSNFDEDKEYSVLLLNHVVQVYSKCSDFRAACRLFDRMCQRNIFSWTLIIVGSNENECFIDGFQYLCEMQNYDIRPDAFVYSAIIQSCIGLDSVDLGKMVHAQIVVAGYASHDFVSTSLVDMYAKMGEIECACGIFNGMQERSRVSWNAVISGLTSNELYLEAFSYYLRMKSEGVIPNEYTLVSVLKAISNLKDCGMGREVQNYVNELGLESNIPVGTGLIDMYSKCGYSCDAKSLFEKNFSDCAANTPWNAMIAGYVHCGCVREALELFIRMLRNNIKLDLYTYCSVFNAIASLKCLSITRELHGMVLKSGIEGTVTSVQNAIADAYSKCRAVENVRKVFDMMEQRSVVSWTTLITACSKTSQEEALSVFFNMRTENFKPNEYTFASVLAACASLSCIHYGRQVHALLLKAGMNADKCIETALVDMYAKCGCMSDSAMVFQKIFNPDIISWTAIISAYAQHGFAEDALKLFTRMVNLGIKPNAATLLCVLFACSHAGMVEQGLHFFETMLERYNLMPEMEHYACVIDLLGRNGHLDSAMEFVDKMPIEPNEMIWQTLLGACRLHGRTDLGEIVAKKIFTSTPEYSAPYVLLAQTYVETGNYRDGLRLRHEMKRQGVAKEPGCSWITVNGRVHRFYAQDQLHPQTDEIYSQLEDMRENLEALGYRPDLKFAVKGDG